MNAPCMIVSSVGPHVPNLLPETAANAAMEDFLF